MYAIVTGATSGIGRSIALALASNGYSIATLSRDEIRLNSLGVALAEVNPTGRHMLMKGNLLFEADISQFNERLRSERGIPELIVNCAGIYTTRVPSEMQESDLRQLIDVNFFGAFRITQPWIASLKSRGTGTILSIGSIVTKWPRPHAASYTLSKQLLDNWMQLLAEELRDSGIRITRIQPGSVLTPSWVDETEEMKEHTILPEEIARIVNLVLALPERTWLEEVTIRPLSRTS